MNSSLFSRITSYSITHNLIKPGTTIIIGLSGGPDSVFLLHYLKSIAPTYQLSLVAAYLNHQWRSEADQEAEWCKKLCEQLEIPFETKILSEITVQKKYNGSHEEVARIARRIFFEQLAARYTADAVALAHHADDQQETFFIRLIRGSSLSGLIGMKSQDGLYIRPLLTVKKEDILHDLHEKNIAYCVDTSNTSPHFLRNRIRTEVLPALQKADSRWDMNFAATHAQLQETENFLQQLTHEQYAQIITTTCQLIIKPFLALHPVLQHRILLSWLIHHKIPFTPSQGLFNEIIRFLTTSKPGSHTLYDTWVIQKNKTHASVTMITN